MARRMGGSALEAQVTEELLAQKALEAVQVAEQKLDAELKELTVSSDADLERLRQKRLAELKQRSVMESEWRRKGHGKYQEIGDQKEFFDESKTNERVVCHFNRPSTWRCEIIDKHLEKLAAKHIETRFIKIDAEKTPFLAERLNVVLLPTLCMFKDNFSHDRIEGFDELGGRDDFTTEQLELRLAKNGIIDYEPPASTLLQNKNKLRTHNKNNVTGDAIYRNRPALDSDEEFSDDD